MNEILLACCSRSGAMPPAMVGMPQPPVARPVAAAPEMQKMMVTVPDGHQGGMVIQVQTTAGLMEVNIPPGLGPGQQFEMMVPSVARQAPQPVQGQPVGQSGMQQFPPMAQGQPMQQFPPVAQAQPMQQYGQQQMQPMPQYAQQPQVVVQQAPPPVVVQQQPQVIVAQQPNVVHVVGGGGYYGGGYYGGGDVALGMGVGLAGGMMLGAAMDGGFHDGGFDGGFGGGFDGGWD
jgi:hypothetical protein